MSTKFPKLKGRAILSPMAGVTDVAFRAQARRLGAALTYTEFVSSAGLVRGNKNSLDLVKTDEIEKPVAVQLFGSNVAEVVQAANLLQGRFNIVDINCGCPAWKVIKTGAGSAMLNDPKQIEDFIKQLVKELDIPVTIKIRTGINKDTINAVQIAKIAEKAGAAAIAIHGRTQKQGYSGVSDWDIIEQVKKAVSIPVIGNGDVFSPETFKQRLEESGVDYIMIARGAIGKPYIFKQINDYLETGTYKEENPLEHFQDYLVLAKKHNVNFTHIKHHAISFTKGIKKSADLRRQLSKAKTIKDIKEIIDSALLTMQDL